MILTLSKNQECIMSNAYISSMLNISKVLSEYIGARDYIGAYYNEKYFKERTTEENVNIILEKLKEMNSNLLLRFK